MSHLGVFNLHLSPFYFALRYSSFIIQSYNFTVVQVMFVIMCMKLI